MDDIQNAYEDLVNRIFESAYLELVEAIIKERKERRLARDISISGEVSRMHLKDAEMAKMRADYLSQWFVDVTPKYRDIDGKMFRKWADEEADEYERTGHRRNHRPEAKT